MPNLEVLELPSAPSNDFFSLPKLTIQHLVIQAGYEHHNFIENLSTSSNLPNLKSLDYTDPFDHFGDLEDEEFTSFAHFEKLFNSNVFSYNYFHLTLRENRLSKEQLETLQKIKNIQLFHIKTEEGKYIRM